MGGAWPLQWVTCMRFLKPRPHKQRCWSSLLLRAWLPRREMLKNILFLCPVLVKNLFWKKERKKMLLVYIVTWPTAMTSCAVNVRLSNAGALWKPAASRSTSAAEKKMTKLLPPLTWSTCSKTVVFDLMTSREECTVICTHAVSQICAKTRAIIFMSLQHDSFHPSLQPRPQVDLRFNLQSLSEGSLQSRVGEEGGGCLLLSN